MGGTTNPLARLSDLILDLDYGDEQERFRYYETYSVAVHLQLILLPVVGAAVVLFGGSAMTGPVLVMLGAAFTPILFGLQHLRRHAVRTESIAMSKRNHRYMVAYGLSVLTLVVAIMVRTWT